MRDRFRRWFTEFNALLIRVSRGRVGSQLGTQSILILHTVGRKSGRPRLTPIAYFEYHNEYILVASNWGRKTQADWLLNLRQQPRASIDIKGRSLAVHARESQGEEYARLWQYVIGRHAQYLEHQAMTSRRIPIIVLEPAH